MEQVLGDQGVVLMGEAAKAYVQFKYTELYWMIGVMAAIVIFLILFLFVISKN